MNRKLIEQLELKTGRKQPNKSSKGKKSSKGSKSSKGNEVRAAAAVPAASAAQPTRPTKSSGINKVRHRRADKVDPCGKASSHTRVVTGCIKAPWRPTYQGLTKLLRSPFRQQHSLLQTQHKSLLLWALERITHAVGLLQYTSQLELRVTVQFVSLLIREGRVVLPCVSMAKVNQGRVHLNVIRSLLSSVRWLHACRLCMQTV